MSNDKCPQCTSVGGVKMEDGGLIVCVECKAILYTPYGSTETIDWQARALKAEAKCERLKKAELRATKGVVYLAGLLSVKTKEKLSVDWIQEALNLED